MATEQILKEIREFPITTPAELEEFRLAFLSKKGKIATLFAGMGKLPPEQRADFGKQANEVKQVAQQKFETARDTLEQGKASFASARDDISLQAQRQQLGSLHPLTQTLDEIKNVFFRLGFSIAFGPELEDDFHNFSALNFPPEHPARDMQDTFYVRKDDENPQKDLLLRTHTSPVQIRKMLEQKPPIRSIMPGRVYRNEAVTAKSYFLFHQVEALYVDRNVTFAELKDTLIILAEMIFEKELKYRMRPSFFPFTEPSLEMDIWNPVKNQWLEILGAGMVHPNVLRSVNLDPEDYTGFALGMGIERIAKLRYEIGDIRTFYENDVRFLDQFV
jgi:phenylalanyl-tRNA synthetase alpha chain